MLLNPVKFRPGFTQSQLEGLKKDLNSCKLPSPTYQSSLPKYGITHSWMVEALRYWKEDFDWNKCEEKFNDGIDHYNVEIDGFNLHFMAHYSDDPNAITILFLHGWPGSFLEFIEVFKLLKTSTSPSFNLICPSQLGYGFSSDPPLDKYFGMYEQASLFRSLMVGLGFGEKGYAVQGGDIGSVIARIMACKYPEEVKAVNINYMPIAFPKEENQGTLNLTERELINVEKAKVFAATGRGYGIMHGTRPSTIGIVVQSSPVALLAWLGEKFRDWTDDDLNLDQVLETVTLWWVLECFPKAIYAYEQLTSGVGAWHQNPELYIKQPFAYSSFAKEIASAPKTWAAETGNLVYYNYLEKGGHFAALERPHDFAEEMKRCFGQIYPRA